MLKKHLSILWVLLCNSFATAEETSNVIMDGGSIAIAAHYPNQAKEKQLQGDVLCGFIVDESGQISQLRMMVSSGHATLDLAAAKAVYAAKVRPKVVDGRAVATQYFVKITFGLPNQRVAQA